MATTKMVQVLCRYSHKTDGKLNGIVTYLVRASDGESTYCTTLVQGKASGCSRKSRKDRCYHRTQLEALEASRKPVAPKATKQDDNMSVQVATPMVVEEYRMAKGVLEKLAAIAKPKIKDIATMGNLNGTQQTGEMPAWLAILPSRRQQVATYA